MPLPVGLIRYFSIPINYHIGNILHHVCKGVMMTLGNQYLHTYLHKINKSQSNEQWKCVVLPEK